MTAPDLATLARALLAELDECADLDMDVPRSCLLAIDALRAALDRAGPTARTVWVCTCMEVGQYDRGDVERCPKHRE